MSKVSVIIPVFNVEGYLTECLQSVANQTFSDLQIICVDDGSTDESSTILSGFAKKDKRFVIKSQENSGPGVARNTGFQSATGQYVIFLDSDDWFEPDFIQKMVSHAELTNSDVTICRTLEFDTDSNRECPADWMLKKYLLPATVFSPFEISNYLFQFTYGMAWDKLYRRDLIIRENLKFPDLRNSEDLAFVYPSLLVSKKISILDEVLIHHRINRKESVSNTRTIQPDAPYIAFQIVKEFLEQHGFADTYKQSFMNWAMEFLVWHVCNIGNKEVQKDYIHIIRRKWFPELGFDKYPRTYYRDKNAYMKYVLVKNAPVWFIRQVIKTYKKLKNK